jgi:hypothetical protein
MDIYLKEIPIREIVDGYVNNLEEGVLGYGGRLNIRPKYQREFVYKDKQRDEVINTIRNDFPLNVMYWVKSGEDSYEVLDGQQRTISFCEYVDSKFSINYQYFHNLEEDQREQILDYKLMIYICEGSDSEKLDWFKIINIAGEKLSDQELRNAIYTGPWLTEAKRYFSKTGCPANSIASDYLSGSSIRQDYLETAIKWIASKENKEIEEYMSEHQYDTNANELWLYFKRVIDWVQVLFPNYRKEMKGIEWGLLYNDFSENSFDAAELERQVRELMDDDEVTSNKGIYPYLITGEQKHLNLRAFKDKIKRKAYEEQEGICVVCKEHFEYDRMEADHITPWHEGGKTSLENCQMLCKDCNRRKSGT